jgi:ABC-type sugar transport system substrate-binding protein
MFSAHVEYGVRDRYLPYFGDYFCRSANWDPNKQIEDIKILLAQGIDLLLVDPIDTTNVQAGVEEAMRSGVPVILAPTRVRSDQYVSWVSNSEEVRGETCADWLSRTVPCGALVVLQSVPAADDSAAWLRGVLRRLDSQSELQVTALRCPWQASEARRLLAAHLDQRAPVHGMIVSNGLLGQGAVQAFVERGQSIPPIAGGDDSNGWLRVAREHTIRFLGTSGGANMGLHCVELATRILSGQPVQRHVEFPYQTFEADAPDRYYRADLSDHHWAVHDLPEDWIDRMYRL